ncbi:conserved protein of unknown function [Magnetospirillum sp. XM-1]|uniref:hypothetical protein n=1 Tax=Magnetospirillum sp. XM-1 TaxID=1663591 RepID=UPI00073DB8F7|nr:hypothetical protein [Magnetospirillum sp. XM-1]CUW41518.1 conserved protein of unknown function [Magnetospirillum sp. XM-1]
MSIGAITGSGSTANLIDAIKALRAGAVAASQAVNNQLDPRDYAEVEEQQSSARQQAAQAQSEQRRQTLDTERQNQDQQSGSRPSSAYLTQALAQEQEQNRTSETSAQSPSATAGSAAYANAAYADAAERASTLSGRDRGRGVEFEVLSPNPSAASGRGVDLSV